MVNLVKAKSMAFGRWIRELEFLNTRSKCKTYGVDETADSLWEKLPKVSKDYWLGRTI